MKKILFILLSVFTLAACNGAENQKERTRKMLAKEVEAANLQIKGLQLDEATRSEGCEFKNDVYYYYYTVNENNLAIEVVEEMKDLLKENLLSGLESDQSTKELLRLVRSLDGKIIYHYTGSASGKTVTIAIE